MVLLRTHKFGASLRKLAESSLRSKAAKYECPKCGKIKVKRVMNSVWRCRACESTYAGGAFSFGSEAGTIATRLMREYAKLS